eukprot:CAMPEP_0172057402 /NCGR_PEP_ID=MMETSP1043-20130122/6309_1 /TAXON_ID=464988 /ORGANISM="Hemiselmis andersenii, Strain CCMP441" /LENGTH=55 /DNA_ID=CAMNT_0012716893 /DNA_START=106 /DNA_END=273 /DNA_ORIENTATION=+
MLILSLIRLVKPTPSAAAFPRNSERCRAWPAPQLLRWGVAGVPGAAGGCGGAGEL